VPAPSLSFGRRTQISVHAADVKTTLRVYSIEVAAREKDDLNEDPIVVRLRKVRPLLSRFFFVNPPFLNFLSPFFSVPYLYPRTQYVP
jgi:hypothetical protein